MNDAALVKALKALGHPQRFRMVQAIAEAGELSCGEIVEKFPLSQPTISHHLKILTDAGLLVSRREGQHTYTSVNQPVIDALRDLLPGRLNAAPPASPRRRRAEKHP
jgi:ArsR family transcriptional regulator